jgi:glycosyltransferase involved in cell wall biosynthesis
MIASFKRQKNHPAFFRMAKAVLQQLPETRFLCVGEPLRDNQQGAADYHREVSRLVDSLGVRDRCLFVGNRQDMPEVYSACDLTVLPSTREGTPNVLLESMACGVPVVATDVADNAYIVPHGRAGFIVPLHDVVALTSRVSELIADRAKRQAMGAWARDWVRREFSTAALADKTAAIYVECLTRKCRVRG